MIDKLMEKHIRKFIKWLHKRGFCIADDEGYAISNDSTNRLILNYLETRENNTK